MKRRVSRVLQDCLNRIDPETLNRTRFEYGCLEDWDTCHDDILEEAREEGLPLGVFDSKLINLTKFFYLKGVEDAYKKLKKND